MPCSRGGCLSTMTPLNRMPKVITAVALVAMLHLQFLQPAMGQAYTLPGLSDLPALPGLASGLINSVTSGASWAKGVQVLTAVAADDVSCPWPMSILYICRAIRPRCMAYCAQ